MIHLLLEYRLDLLLYAALAVGGMAAVHLWLRRARRTGGVRPAAWAALGLLVAGGVAAAAREGELERHRLRATLEAFASTYAQELEQMGHARVGWDTAADDPLYRSMIEAQVRWLRANCGVADIYSFRRTGDGQVAFLVDSETDYDHDGRIEGEREARTQIGEVYPEADDNMSVALAGARAFSEVPVTDRWGTWVSAYVPLRGAEGATEGALGVDFDAADWSASILSRRGAVLGAASVLVVVLLASTATGTALRAEVERRRAVERQIRHSEERFRVAARCASDNIYEWDLASGRLEWFGDGDSQFRRLLPTLDAWERALHPEDREAVVKLLGRHVASGEPFRASYRLVAPDGTVRHMNEHGAFLHDAGGPRRMVGVLTDVTGETQARALEAEKAALKRAVASMEQVLGIVAHELRTPLAGVRAMSEFLLDGAARGTAEFDRFLQGMNQEVVRLAETVNNLLEAARLNSGRAKWNWSTFSAAAACREAVERVRPLVDAGSVDVSCDVAGGEAEMAGDADAVVRLVLNLLGNAVRHTPAGRISVTARVVGDDLGGGGARGGDGRRWVELRVCDTGEGIAPEILDRLGEPFAMNAGIVGAKHVKGTGLGLAICRGIVEAHAGEMTFDSRVGQGTRVTVRLRADLPAPAAGDVGPPVPAGGAGRAATA